MYVRQSTITYVPGRITSPSLIQPERMTEHPNRQIATAHIVYADPNIEQLVKLGEVHDRPANKHCLFEYLDIHV